MISPEIIRRYPFFAGLDHEQIIKLAKFADEMTFQQDHVFFHEGDDLNSFYLILKGSVAIVIEVPDREQTQSVAGQLTGEMITKDIIVSHLGSGDVFGWSAIIPPNVATAGAKAVSDCRIVVFNCTGVKGCFEEDPDLAYKLTMNAAQLMRERLRDMRIETLAYKTE